jgi:Ca2+-binding RTX toxin-like protein
MAHGMTNTTRRARVRLWLLVSIGVLLALVATGSVAPAGAATVYCYGQRVTVVGTSASETINAADGVTGDRDVINGLGGDDVIFGLGGDDVICGGDGHDRVHGGYGSDRIAGNLGDDSLDGDGDDDWLEGFQGDDVIDGGDGDDLVEGGDGNDFDRDWGDDSLWGGDDTDYVRGSGGNDYLQGGVTSPEEARLGYGGWDLLYGYGGDDALVDTVGYDFLVAGEGNDSLYSRDAPIPSSNGDEVFGGGGTDQCTVDANDENHDSACETWQQPWPRTGHADVNRNLPHEP